MYKIIYIGHNSHSDFTDELNRLKSQGLRMIQVIEYGHENGNGYAHPCKDNASVCLFWEEPQPTISVKIDGEPIGEVISQHLRETKP